MIKYTNQQIKKILSSADVGLSWSEDQISTCISNLFKLGLTQLNFSLMNAFCNLWLKNGLNDTILKVFQTYIPKVFIFLKHQKLFDISLKFLQEFCLGSKYPTKGIMNKKECPSSKKIFIYEFLCLIQIKYQKIAGLDDKLYIELKNKIKKIKQDDKIQPFKSQQIQNKLKILEWEQIKVPLFGKNYNNKNTQNYIIKQSTQYRGLYNIGNSCYMNSFLQCLFMNIELRKNILNQSTLLLEKNIILKMHQNKASNMNQCQQNNKQKQNIPMIARQFVRPVAQLQRLFSQLIKSNRPSISPISIKNISSSEFKNTFQQDTIQFGRSFIDILSKSMIDNVFEGQQTNEIVCSHCKKSRFKRQGFMDLMINEYTQDIIDQKSSNNTIKQNISNGLNLQKMIQKSFQQQQIQGLICDYCNIKSQKSLKKHFISKLPNYLILTLKRFQYNIKQNKNIKKHYQIDLKDCYLNISGQLYNLYAIIIHRGQSANSGHYFAFCRQWKFQQQQKKIVNQNQNQKLNSQNKTLMNQNKQTQIKQINLQKIQQQNINNNLQTKQQIYDKIQIQYNQQQIQVNFKNQDIINNKIKQIQKMQIQNKQQYNLINNKQKMNQFTYLNQQNINVNQKQKQFIIKNQINQKQLYNNKQVKSINNQYLKSIDNQQLKQINSQQLQLNNNKYKRWICLNDSIISMFDQFKNVKQFLDINNQDTPYILFYQKVSHITSKQCQNLKYQIKLRQPLQKFIQKDNNQYIKLLQNKKKMNQNSKVDWKNFGKIKGFTAYDYFKFTKGAGGDDDDQNNNGFGGGGSGFNNNMPIL